MTDDLQPRQEWDALTTRERGLLERPLEGEAWGTPGNALDLIDDKFTIDFDRMAETWKPVRATSGLLEQFVSLSTHPNQSKAAVAYARRWGLLDLCEHWLPVSHPLSVPICVGRAGITSDLTLGCRTMGPAAGAGQPVAALLFWSDQLRALLNVIARLEEGRLGRAEDWQVIGAPSPWSALEGWDRLCGPLGDANPPRVATQRRIVAEAISAFLQVAGVGVRFRWDQRDPEIGAVGGGLFGALWQQTMLAAGDSPGTALCAACGRRHHPRRSGPVSYCQTCRDQKVPQQRARRRYWERMHLNPEYQASERKRARANRAGVRNPAPVRPAPDERGLGWPTVTALSGPAASLPLVPDPANQLGLGQGSSG